jgi:wobble nucleotide-excising tRNase
VFKKIDITKFALFNDFIWNRDRGIKDNEIFKKVNIIYGRNYSGKTTLSRLFRCIEKNEIHHNYSNADFSIELSAGNKLSQQDIGNVENNIKIRVYNTDFIKDNLSFLHRDDGKIEPFTLLGSYNVELGEKIKDIDEALGKENDSNGLLFSVKKTIENHRRHTKLINNHNDALENLLKEKARKIKIDGVTFNVSNYTITQIKQDIVNITEKNILSEQEIAQIKILIKEDAKADIQKLPESKPKFSEFYENSKNLLTKEVKPSQELTDLINNKILQEWVRQGIEQHKNKEICSFCGNPIPQDLWNKLDAHFNKESETLRNDINEQIKILQSAKQHIDTYSLPNKYAFYESLHTSYDAIIELWHPVKASYADNLAHLIEPLQKREKDIFTVQPVIELEDVSEKILELFKELNKLIYIHNKKSSTLSLDQKKARNDLRLSVVANFLKDIDYKNKTNEINNLKAELPALKMKEENEVSEISTLKEHKRKLEAQAKDESKGAELVNTHLTRFFGCDGLQLVAEKISDSPVTRFKIIRDGVEANNLSEGECSLIAFCYFIAKIEDELNNHELIVYIDDPISSLDSNHIYFMFSLIDSVIAQPKRYTQLFISTHNLDFLKYLQRISVPTDSSGKKDIAHFLIQKEQKLNDKRSRLITMPDYIKKYSTEFNY